MRIRIPDFLVFALVACLCLAASDRPAKAAETRKVSLVLICDIYDMGEANGRGGFARIAGALKAERERGGNLIVAHAGDTLSPSLMSGFDRGAHIIDLTNDLAPDVFVPGNHEFDFGEEVFRERMAEARFPLLAANLRSADGSPVAGFEDTRMFDFDGLKVGVVGLTAENSVEKSSPGTLRFTSSVETVRTAAAALRDQGAHIVVAVAHAPIRTDLRILGTGAVDILLSGDDHDLILTFNGAHVMAEAKEEGEYVVAVDLDVTLPEGGEGAARWWPRFRIIDTADVTPDPDMARKVAAYEAELSKELDVALGQTATELDSRKSTVRAREAAIGNLIADAIRTSVDADAAIMNGGGIRANRRYPAGSTLTRRNVLEEMPFGNKIMLFEMTGADLLATLENGLWYAGKANGRFAHVSGLTIRARTDAAPGKRIVEALIGGAPVDPAKTYRVATNDFVGRGKEGYGAFTKARVILSQTDGELMANAVMRYIRENSPISPKVEGRIVLE